ncbi:MAG: DoxX family protein [Gammaproteobacteria bacterium]
MFIFFQKLLDKFQSLDFLASLALRLFLAPIFWLAGYKKLSNIEGTIGFFNSLNIPYPEIAAWTVALVEAGGAILLLIGLAVRWISIPLMVTMAVAAFTVHWKNGWQAIADAGFCLFNCTDAEAASERLTMAKSILQEHGNYEWLTEQGNIAIVNSGIELATTYFIMLLALFFLGAGKYFSLDYWIRRAKMNNN